MTLSAKPVAGVSQSKGGDKPSCARNHTVLSKDGREVPIDDSAAPIRGADARILSGWKSRSRFHPSSSKPVPSVAASRA